MDERDLLRRAREGDKAARDKLVIDNMPLVHKVAQRYRGLMPYEDIIQEGVIGLLEAIDHYDLDKDVKYVTYAWYWVYRAIGNAVAKQDGTGRNHCTDTEIRRLQTARAELIRLLDREPTDEELADETGIAVTRVSGLLQRDIKTVSLDSKLTDDSDDTLLDLIPAPKNVDSDKLRKAVRYALSQLDPLEAEMLADRYGIYETKKGRQYWMDMLGVSAQTVYNMRAEALRKLRSPDIIDALHKILAGGDVDEY